VVVFPNVQALLKRIPAGQDSGLELMELRFKGRSVSDPSRDRLADELAAFANTRGGICVLGVTDQTRTIAGIPVDRHDTAEAFVRDICNDSINPPLVAHINKLQAGGDEAPWVIQVEIPRGLFVHKSPGGYFHRIGSSKREMTPEYLGRLFQQRSQARLIRFDEQAVTDATLDDLDPVLWERFRTSRSLSDTRESLLDKLGLARPDAEGTLRPTVSGVLLASRDPREFLPNAYIQAVAYRGTTPAAESDRKLYQLDAADITGPIDQQVVDAVRFVARNMHVRAMKDMGRRDIPQYDLTAVFEALVNAVAHRDYAVHGAKIRLRMFSNRLEICSPGELPNTMSVGSLPLRQAARNEVLTSLLARCPIPRRDDTLETDRTAYMDKRGEGVGIILERSLKLSGRLPEYSTPDGGELQLTIWPSEPEQV